MSGIAPGGDQKVKKGDSLVLNLVVLLFLASWLGKSANMVCSFQFRNRSATLRIDNREYRNLKLKIVHNKSQEVRNNTRHTRSIRKVCDKRIETIMKRLRREET